MGPKSIWGHCSWLCPAMDLGWEQELIKLLWSWFKGKSDPTLLWRAAVLMGLGAVSSRAGGEGRAGRGCGMDTASGGPLLTSSAQHPCL